ncbi:MAG: hypothetical protein PHD70_05410 [Anaerostipes sp.]|jgi:hypothetical protein|nr:hypothetical protein [Anaerostipes sp.]MDD3745893.1 hypothetical protein [Anaerostipes sp.]
MKIIYEASSFRIQPHWVIPFAILGLIGLLLIFVGKRKFFKLLGSVCIVICAVVFLRFCYGYWQIIHAYNQGNYKTIDGYVENFTPASKGGETDEDSELESFDIKGVHFSYGDSFIKKFGYHLPSTQGGYIKRNGQHLRIGYITNDENQYVIVKIEEEK